MKLLEGSVGFVVYFDASWIGLCCVLMQYGKVNAYTSTKLNLHKNNYLTYDLEVVAMVFIWKIRNIIDMVSI